METFFVQPEEFWNWFNRENDHDEVSTIGNPVPQKVQKARMIAQTTPKSNKPQKKPKLEAESVDRRYIILFGPHKPGKKNKVWTGDGYLSMVGDTAHVVDLKGRMLEDPTILDDDDLKAVEDLGEILVGNTEVQIIELDKK